MGDPTNELMLEILKEIQKDVAQIKATLADHSRQFVRVREDIHSLRGDDLRRETLQIQLDNRLERIETRLNLHDAECRRNLKMSPLRNLEMSPLPPLSNGQGRQNNDAGDHEQQRIFTPSGIAGRSSRSAKDW